MTTVVSWKTSLGMVLFGMPFLLVGAWLVLSGVDVLPIDKRYLNVPPWVLIPIGLVFALPGGAYVSAGLKSLTRGGVLGAPTAPAIGLVIAMVLSCMAVGLVASAFFGQSRGFYGGISFFGLRWRGASAAMTGRVVFTATGLVVAVIAAVFWLLSISAFSARGKRGERPPTTG